MGKPEQRETTYAYTTLTNGKSNIFSVPNIIQKPYQTISNVINSQGWLTQQTSSSTQAGSTDKVVTYRYQNDSSALDYGLLLWVDGPRTGTIDKVSYTYDTYGNKASQSQLVNGVTRTTQYINYNSFGKPERIIYPNGLADAFIYNADGTTKNQTHGTLSGSIVSGQLTSFTYNAQKQVLTTTNPDNEVTTYVYDTLGRLVQTINADGSVNKKSYHSNNVVSAEELVDSAGTLYQGSYQTLDGNARVLKVQAGASASRNWISYAYDDNGNVLNTNTPIGVTESWTYDALNRVKTHTDGEGKVDSNDYDLEDNITSATDAAG